MADVEVQMQFTTTERKVRKVKKTSKRRESSDTTDRVESEVTITEIEKENQLPAITTESTTTTITTQEQGYVLSANLTFYYHWGSTWKQSLLLHFLSLFAWLIIPYA